MRYVSRSLACTLFALSLPAALGAQSFRPEGGAPPSAIGFGVSVAMSGNEIFVGRPGLISGFPMPPSETGAIHIYRRGASGWTETGSVSARDTVVGDGFGLAVAADANVMVVGAPNAEEGKGAVYIFERDRAGRWAERARLQLTDGAAADEFGAAVAVANGVVLAGAPGHASKQGVVVAYRRDARAGSWSEAGRLSGSGIAAGDHFGTSLSL
ncbi:MAG: FG-GAP repeat protein, partial [Gemmatimonadaceae bacterium]